MLQLEEMSTAKIVLFHQGSTELRRCENCVFFLPVNILTGVTRRLLGPHDTLPCVLIFMCNSIPLNILSISHRATFRRFQYNFLCSTHYMHAWHENLNVRIWRITIVILTVLSIDVEYNEAIQLRLKVENSVGIPQAYK